MSMRNKKMVLEEYLKRLYLVWVLTDRQFDRFSCDGEGVCPAEERA